MAPSTDSYQNGNHHLSAELGWINLALTGYIERFRQADTATRFNEFSGFYISDSEVDAIVESPQFQQHQLTEAPGKADSTPITALRQQIDSAINTSLEQGVYLPLAELRRRFHLDDFEYQTFLFCLAAQLDIRYEKLFAYLQNDISKRIPGVDLILDLLCPTYSERPEHLLYFHPEARLRYFRLITCLPSDFGNSANQVYLKVDPRLVYFVLGDQAPETTLQPALTITSPLAWDQVVLPSEIRAQLTTLFAALYRDPQQRHKNPMLYLYGKSGIGKKSVARALAGEAGLNLGVLRLDLLSSQPEQFSELLRLNLREGLLQPCVVAIEKPERLKEMREHYPQLLQRLANEINDSGWMIILLSDSPPDAALLKHLDLCPVELPAPGYTDQQTLWQMHLTAVDSDEVGQPATPEITGIIDQLELTGGQISQAVRLAQRKALLRSPDSARPTMADLLGSGRLLSQPKLSNMAKKIEPKFNWNDIVLPEEPLKQLRELANQVKFKNRVIYQWGFDSKLSLGRGLSALFAGPSGTGKTMAAEVVANELKLDLFKIDLAGVVSKYIGETEKNLNRIFDEAQSSNAILFFDEADALLGKRSEVKDAHDRYANIEVAYLLQKMEEYEGITILATNLKQNIDDAFTRRIRFVIEFPFPRPEYRNQIWQGIWPEETPLDQQVDLTFLAQQFEFSGGNIRNVALTAAFFAAENGGLVKMDHLIRATRREFQKMGKLCVREDFGIYQNLLD